MNNIWKQSPVQNLDQQTIISQDFASPPNLLSTLTTNAFFHIRSFLQVQCHVGTFWRVSGILVNVLYILVYPTNFFHAVKQCFCSGKFIRTKKKHPPHQKQKQTGNKQQKRTPAPPRIKNHWSPPPQPLTCHTSRRNHHQNHQNSHSQHQFQQL